MSELMPYSAPSLIPVGEEWNTMKNLAGILVKSEMIPKSINTPEKAVAIMIKGRELGIPPMVAFSKISIINGTPTMGAELMLSLIRRRYPAAVIRWGECSDKVATVVAARPGDELTEFKFTIEDAAKMQLSSKDNWKKMPRVMLRWRVVSEMARVLFPECLMGVSYTPEEINPDIVLSEDADIIDLDIAPPVSAPERAEKRAEITRELTSEGFDDQRGKMIARIKEQAERMRKLGVAESSLFKALKIGKWEDLEALGLERLRADLRKMMAYAGNE